MPIADGWLERKDLEVGVVSKIYQNPLSYHQVSTVLTSWPLLRVGTKTDTVDIVTQVTLSFTVFSTCHPFSLTFALNKASANFARGLVTNAIRPRSAPSAKTHHI